MNSLLLTLSAPVLSLSDFKQIGNRNPGKDVATNHTKAIWARVSNDAILRCIFGSKGTFKFSKSSCDFFFRKTKIERLTDVV